MNNLPLYLPLVVVVLSIVQKRFVDWKKVPKGEERWRIFSSVWIPRRFLTPVGQKIWLARNILFVLAVVMLVSLALHR